MNLKVYGFTAHAARIENQLISPIICSQAFDPSQDPSRHPCKKIYKGLWDTGATNTVITEKVVQECALEPIGKVKVETASGTDIVDMFLVNVELPNKVGVHHLLVSKGKVKGADVLIGMDIINQGDLAISNFKGKTTFSFRMPSIESIDLNLGTNQPVVNQPFQKVGRNDPCPCGSGKKYKKCCSK
ncbi:MAG: SEC-C metal-binding domain-containing protein [Smithellaceae bacterium]|nr:SEC-C metal-binding domain-containing protein [Smithellaceae bacterium]